MLLQKSCEGRFEIAIDAGIHNNELQAQRERRHPQIWDHKLGSRKSRVRENAEQGSVGYYIVDQLQSFRRQLDSQNRDAGEVRAGPIQAGDKTPADAAADKRR